MKLRRMVSCMMALLLACSLPVSAFAAEYDLAQGSVTVNATESGQTVTHGSNAAVPDSAPVITQSNSSTPTTNTVTITADAGATANVTLSGVNINTSGAAVEIKGNGDVVIELDGSNTVQSGDSHAGVEKNDSASTGKLTITDETGKDGSLKATGGKNGAGIGGGCFGSGSDITITGSAEVTANGGSDGSGIGGGALGTGSNITIEGSAEVTAQGNNGGAGIGGGALGTGSNIIITGSAEVTAKGDISGAGIGGGYNRTGSDITVSEDAQVKAQGGNGYHSERYTLGTGAAIGGGGSNNSINGQEVAPNTNALNEGWIATYAPGTENMNTATPDSLTYKDTDGTVQTVTENITVLPAQSATDDTHEQKAGFKVGDVEVAVKTHRYGNYQSDDNATCTHDGTESAKCTVPGCTKTHTIPDPGTMKEHSFTNYISDGNATYDADGTKTAECDHCDATDTIPDPGSKLVREEATQPAQTPYRVVGQDGKAISCKAEQENGVLTITVDADFATLTGSASGLKTLKAQGVETIVFVTTGATSTFALADLLAQVPSGSTYALTHVGSTVTLTLGSGVDVSSILK